MKRLVRSLSLIALLAVTSSCGEDNTVYTAFSEQTEMKVVVKDLKNPYHYASNCSASPTSGDVPVLIIPVWFTDSKTYISTSTYTDSDGNVVEYRENVRDDIRKAYLGTTEETGWHSVASYYKEESLGKLNLNGVVADWYEVDNSSSYYAESSNTTELVCEATDAFFEENTDYKRTDFDSDGDGFIDSVVLIYGAPDYNAGKAYSSIKSNSNLWAYCYWVSDLTKESTTEPGPNVYFWASYDFMYDAETCKERTGKSSVDQGDCSHCEVDAHTFIHEFGHVMGLQDYYDYSGQSSPAGGFSMQDNNVGGHDPYSTLCYGWVNPYIPTESSEITLKPFQSSHDCILLTPEWNEDDSPFDEYILLELYTPTGLNELDTTYVYDGQYPSGSQKTGLRVWHVDARLYCALKDGSGAVIDTNPNDKSYKYSQMAVTNTLPGSSSSKATGHLGPVKALQEANELQLLSHAKTRTLKGKETDVTYTRTYNFDDDDLWMDGDSFSMGDYSAQFLKGSKLDSDKDLGWSFSVSITGEGEDAVATVKCKRS